MCAALVHSNALECTLRHYYSLTTALLHCPTDAVPPRPGRVYFPPERYFKWSQEQGLLKVRLASRLLRDLKLLHACLHARALHSFICVRV